MRLKLIIFMVRSQEVQISRKHAVIFLSALAPISYPDTCVLLLRSKKIEGSGYEIALARMT